MAIANAIVETTPTTIYQSVGSTAITFVSLCNYSVSTVYVDVYLVPNGSPVTNACLLAKELELVVADTYELYHAAEKFILDNNDRLVMVSSEEDAVAVSVSYVGV